jgi:hypothetical protein
MNQYLPMSMPSSTKTIVGLSPLDEAPISSSRPTRPTPLPRPPHKAQPTLVGAGPRHTASPRIVAELRFAPAQPTRVGIAPEPHVPAPAAARVAAPPPVAIELEALDVDEDDRTSELPMTRIALTVIAAATVVFIWLVAVTMLVAF